MLGRIGYNAARGQWRSYQKSRKQPGGPWTFTAVLFCVLPETVLWMLVTVFRPSWVFWPLLGVNAVLVWLVLASAGFFTRRSYARRAAARYDRVSGYSLDDPAVLRERAAELRELAALRAAAGRGELRDAPEPGVTATWQSAPEEDPEAAGRAERARRVADLFATGCPDPPEGCAAPEAVACIMGNGIPVAVVDRERVRFCHLSRMTAAVAAGTADAGEVLAQFGLEPGAA